MLSYQHGYHAGSAADVHKHAALAVILAKLITKNKPLHYLETHAGCGIYDLKSAAAQKTQEASEGILKLLAADKIPNNHPYFQAMQLTQSLYGQNYYPGSPWVAKSLLRDSDQMYLMELHPQEYLTLKNNIKAENIHIHKRDGYEGVLAIASPIMRRGLVFIDPSYEVKTEYAQAAEFIIKLHQKWSGAVILAWYPLLDAKYHQQLCNLLLKTALPKFWQQEVFFKEIQPSGIRGSGLICIN